MIIVPTEGAIALVDDDEIDRMIISRVVGLSHLRNPVREYSSATALIRELEGPAADAPDIAVVLMDINMPGMTGLEALAHIRTESGLTDLPIVVMLTSSDAKADKERAERLGAHGYVVKQSGIEAFVATINETLSHEVGS